MLNVNEILDLAKNGIHSAKSIVELLEINKIGYEVLDADNMFDENDGMFNMIVDGLPEGESMYFYNGQYQD